jgi:hypothetical protein
MFSHAGKRYYSSLGSNKLLGVTKLKMILGVEGVEPPAWGQCPQTPPSQLIVATYLHQNL